MIPLSLANELMAVCLHFQYSSTGIDPDGQEFAFKGGSLSTSELRPFTFTTFSGDTEVFVTNNGLGDIVVVFRGSEYPFGALTQNDSTDDHIGGIQDWFGTDFMSTRIGYPPAPSFWPDTRWVHRGFWEAYDSVSTQLVRLVQQQIDLHPTRNIYVTGHSLGGAIAYLAALDLSWNFIPFPVHLFSFASPRVGDIGLNHLLMSSVASSYFVILHGDPVPHLPPVGPNLPVTFKQVFRVKLGPFTVGFGNALPQLFQNYDTGKEVVYINEDLTIDDKLPVGEVALAFGRHYPEVYAAEIGKIAPSVTTAPTTASERKKKVSVPPLLHAAMQS